jgi:predicted nucleic acid-binding protein
MEKYIGIKIKYLDASAIVKLYLDEEGSDYFRDYFNNHTNFCTVQMTFYEAMSVLKARLFNKDKEKYRKSVEDLIISYWSKEQSRKIVIEEIELNNYKIYLEISEIIWRYNIDFADAIQIYAIVKGKYSHFALDSKSVLITADDKLEFAAEDNHIRVWNCRKSAQPDWLDN